MQIENCKMKIENRGLWSLISGLRPLLLHLRSSGFGIRSVARFSTLFIKTKEQSPKTKDQKPSCPNLQFSFFNFHFSIPFLLCSLLFALCAAVATHAQTTPDKMVASVTNGTRATPDLITYSDLVWQLALEPDTPFSARPSSAQLNRALRLVQDQLLILQEARKLPSADTAEANAARDADVQEMRDRACAGAGIVTAT